MGPLDKAKIISSSLSNQKTGLNFRPILEDPQGGAVEIIGLDCGEKVGFSTGYTGETDQLCGPQLIGATYVWVPIVKPQVKHPSKPFTLTGGFRTDLGEEVVTLDSSVLIDQSSAGIARAFYDKLSPHQLDFGVSLSLQGSSLIATFDPRYNHFGGITFGSDSLDISANGYCAFCPEPGTVALFIGAGCSLMALKFRRRKRG